MGNCIATRCTYETVQTGGKERDIEFFIVYIYKWCDTVLYTMHGNLALCLRKNFIHTIRKDHDIVYICMCGFLFDYSCFSHYTSQKENSERRW